MPLIVTRQPEFSGIVARPKVDAARDGAIVPAVLQLCRKLAHEKPPFEFSLRILTVMMVSHLPVSQVMRAWLTRVGHPPRPISRVHSQGMSYQ
jgi:hypothetical protein